MKSITSAIFVNRPVQELDWMVYVLVLCLALIASVRILFSNNFESMKRFEKFQQVNDNQKLFGISFQIVYAVLIASILISYLSDEYDYIFYTYLLKLAVVTVLILLFFVIRKFLSATGAYAFGLNQDNDYILKVFNYYRVFSVVSLWIAVFLFYFTKTNKLILLVVLGTILFSIRAVSFVNAYKNKSSDKTKFWYYNILYLCALEILPLLAFLKFVKAW